MNDVAVRVTFRDAAGGEISAQVEGQELGHLMEDVVDFMEALGWSLLTLSVGDPAAGGGEGSGGAAAT